MRRLANRAFTLIELLVVVAILAMLMAVLIPSLRTARMWARIVRVHADLRQIDLALDAYALDNRDAVPPTRSVCGTNINYQLPVELATQRYFPRAGGNVPQAAFQDYFRPDQTYKYLAPGPMYQNGLFYDFPKQKWRPRAGIWVPDDFPRCRSAGGAWYHDYFDEPRSPIRYAIWSIGPDPSAAKFPRVTGTDQIDEFQFPTRREHWLTHAGDTGLITHMKARSGFVYTSP